MTPEEVTAWRLWIGDFECDFMFDAIPDDDFGRERERELFEWIRHCQKTMPELCDIKRSNRLSHINVKECSVTIAGFYIGTVEFIRKLKKNDKTENDHRISELARIINFYAE